MNSRLYLENVGCFRALSRRSAPEIGEVMVRKEEGITNTPSKIESSVNTWRRKAILEARR